MLRHIFLVLIFMLFAAISAFAQDAPQAQIEVLADSIPPNACIVFPDSGGIYGDSFVVKARSEDQDIDEVCLWYRIRPDLNDPPGGDPGPWQECQTTPCMSRPGGGYVFFDTVYCIHDYIGWVELLPLSCDMIGNCQDTIQAYEDACLDDDEGNLVPGHFLFFWDTTRCLVQVISVNDAISPQTLCGFNVRPDTMNKVVINVVEATLADSFTIDVRALKDDETCRIYHANNVTMPCTIDVSVENWPGGTQNLFVYVEDQGNGQECVPSPLIIDLCVPHIWPLIEIVAPCEWQIIPCSGEDSIRYVPIWAYTGLDSGDTMVTQVQFWWSPTGDSPWYFIDEVFEKNGDYWETRWNNSGLVENGDTVYLIAVGYDQYHTTDTSAMVKVFVDCQALNAQLLIEDIVTTCFGIPKVAGLIDLKAVEDTMVSVQSVYFYYKLSSDPDLFQFWVYIGQGEPVSENVFIYRDFNTASLTQNLYYDFRARAIDFVGNVMFDLDGDGFFDDSTFIPALAQGSGKRVFVDNEAPQPAFSLVADSACSLFYINPSLWLGGNGKANVKAGDFIIMEISVLPSQDTCEVEKVEYYGRGYEDTTQFYIGTSTVPYHYPINFEPLSEGLIPPYELEDGWWRGEIWALLYDSLGNSKADTLVLFILDVNPFQALIVAPPNDCFLCSDVPMKSAALNPYEISEVTYQHRYQDSTEWTDILDGTSSEPDSFPITWDIIDIPAGAYYLRAVAKDFSGIPDPNPPFIRAWIYIGGDANGDGIVNSADVVYLINYLFKGGPPPQPWEAGDINDDEVINSADVVYLINYLFKGGPPPGC
jgi:hypothetical protein